MASPAGNVVILFFISSVAAWTIDLPEVRRYYFNLDTKKHELGSGYRNRHPNYAEDFSYKYYGEHQPQLKGGDYLEGLYQSIQEFIEKIKHCQNKKQNSQEVLREYWVNRWPTPSPEIQPPNENPQRKPLASEDPRYLVDPRANMAESPCARVKRYGEHVRRIAQLAIGFTRELQDLEYQKIATDKEVDEEIEEKLVLKLAWALDWLAHLTSYRPKPKGYLPHKKNEADVPQFETPPPVVPEQLKRALMACIKEKSDIPATIRCAYPLPLPPTIFAVLNEGDNATFNIATRNQTDFTNSTPYDNSRKKSTDYDTFEDPEYIQKRSTDDYTLIRKMENSRHIQKRSADNSRVFRLSDDPLTEFLKYYTQHKVWANSNSEVKEENGFVDHNKITDRKRRSTYEGAQSHKKGKNGLKHLSDKENVDALSKLDGNILSVLRKRSIDVTKKYVIDSTIDHSDFKNDKDVSDLKAIDVEKILKADLRIINKGLTKDLKVPFNSIKGKEKVDWYPKTKHFKVIGQHPNKIPEDPLQDISKHAKSKAGVHYKNDTQQKEQIDAFIAKLKPKEKEGRSLQKRSVYNEKLTESRMPKYLFKDRAKLQKKYIYYEKITESRIPKDSKSMDEVKDSKQDMPKPQKRSVHSEPMTKPGIPEDPLQDISYYIKNKEGTHYNPDVVNAALVRAGLERVFNNPNIMTTRRFASNYNPAIPNTYLRGGLVTLSDF